MQILFGKSLLCKKKENKREKGKKGIMLCWKLKTKLLPHSWTAAQLCKDRRLK